MSTDMDTSAHNQQSAAMMPLPELLASATVNPLSPSDLMISSTGSAATEQAPGVATTIALARINRLPLLHWLIATINDVLARKEPVQPRPAGTLLECGRFLAEGTKLWAHDWYGHGRRCLVARCTDPAGAQQLATRLNMLLRP